ncbi:General secretion pathway protein M [Candidatus Paraburkholderia kirkii UZHbot1]|uniref:General secretion pathway protein M n=1 Tax=Candidatus Paraburkholderia kirkii UZHbot1 TaxID=1055526 RepID=G4MJS4_9BURK|nr:General secretion pathway protein M [Candidatus Paraburkholderia kirkii UZHbot1]
MKEEIGRSLSEFWEACTARERSLLISGGLVLVLALVYPVLWAPAYEGRQRLRQSLPAMQRQLATMTAQANDARSLAPAAQGVTPTGGALRDALAKSLADNGMQPTQIQVIGAAVQITLKNASFPNWTMWLDDARKQFKVQVSEAHVTALKVDGQVDLTASLQPAGTK